MGSIDRWAKNQIARERQMRNRFDRLDRARAKWEEAQNASTREEAKQMITDLRLILSVGNLVLADIRKDEQQINDLLRSKS